MAATRQDIGRWFDEGVAQKATHMIMVCDTFDHTDYPVYVKADESVRTREKQVGEMLRVMEVYVLDPTRREAQLNERRAFHYE